MSYFYRLMVLKKIYSKKMLYGSNLVLHLTHEIPNLIDAKLYSFLGN